MAYREYQFTVPLLSTAGVVDASATAAGDKLSWAAGPNSYICRRVAIQKTVTDAWAAGAVFGFRVASGSAATATANQFAAVTFATTALSKSGMRFNDGFTPQKIQAGERIVVNVTTLACGDRFRAWALIEPSPERLQNFGTGKFISVTA